MSLRHPVSERVFKRDIRERAEAKRDMRESLRDMKEVRVLVEM